MTTHKHKTIQTMMQGRESLKPQQPTTAARSCRSLNLEPGHRRALRFRFAPLHLCLKVVVLLVALMPSTTSVLSQEVEDTIKIKTRVVFLDALVKDKKTNLPITNLAQQNFEVLDNGKPRQIRYFTREGDARKPLALILILDLREDGAGRFMKRAEIVKAMADELGKLPAGDEVAIVAMDVSEDENRIWVTEFTNDSAELTSALAKIRAIAETNDALRFAKARQQNTPEQSQQTGRETTSQPPANQVVSTELIKGKNGGTVTRTTLSDGSVNLKRVNKDGNVTIEMDAIYDMAAAVREAAQKAADARPNSQASVVWISDGIAPIFFEDRDATEQILLRDNVTFNSLTVELRTLFKLLMPLGKPIAGWMGVSLYGSAKYLAERTGGEAIKVGAPRDYATGLQRIIGNFTARYTLGFALNEDEVDDGNLHSLEVRVKAKDEKGKNRKLLVSSRQGYYMSNAGPKTTTTSNVR